MLVWGADMRAVEANFERKVNTVVLCAWGWCRHAAGNHRITHQAARRWVVERDFYGSFPCAVTPPDSGTPFACVLSKTSLCIDHIFR